MPPAELTRVVYRSILRWTKSAEGVPFTLRGRDVTEVCPHIPSSTGLALEDAKAVKSLAQSSFRRHQTLKDETEASEALELGIAGLRLLNSYYALQLRELKSLRHDHLNCKNIKYSIGQVFLHKRHGYRGVIYGWSPRCEREAGWASKMGVDHDQPFYKVLPDEVDCQRLFGSSQITKYVAEENIMPISVPRRVTHRVLESYFTGYSPSHMRYLPTRQLQYEYPDRYEEMAADAVQCREDTNLLQISDEGEERLFSNFESTKRRQKEGMKSCADCNRTRHPQAPPYEPD